MSTGVTPDLAAVAADFRRDGACVVRRLLDADAVARLREPDLPGARGDLEPGDALEHPLFPLLWPRP